MSEVIRRSLNSISVLRDVSIWVVPSVPSYRESVNLVITYKLYGSITPRLRQVCNFISSFVE